MSRNKDIEIQRKYKEESRTKNTSVVLKAISLILFILYSIILPMLIGITDNLNTIQTIFICIMSPVAISAILAFGIYLQIKLGKLYN